ALGGDTEEAAVAHDGDDTRHAPDSHLVDGEEPRARRGWADDTSEEHAGKTDVLDVGGATGELPRDVAARDALADPAAVGHGFRLRCRRHLTLEIPHARELAVRGPRPARRADRAVADLQVGRGGTELRRCRRDQDLPRLGARDTQRATALFDGQAAGRLPF